jgi:hypothetical protein
MKGCENTAPPKKKMTDESFTLLSFGTEIQ